MVWSEILAQYMPPVNSDELCKMVYEWTTNNIDIFQNIDSRLPHFRDSDPANSELRLADSVKWNTISTYLTATLRQCVNEAEKRKLVSPERVHEYYYSGKHDIFIVLLPRKKTLWIWITADFVLFTGSRMLLLAYVYI